MKNGEQEALGTYDHIRETTGFDIEELMQAHNTKLKEVQGQNLIEFNDEEFVMKQVLKQKILKAAEQAQKNDLISAEEQDEGAVSFQDVKNFFQFSTGTFGIFLYVFLGFASSFS